MRKEIKRDGGEELVKDPVCGMDVEEKGNEFKAEHMGKTYYFCCAPCKEKFEATPHKYMKM